MQGYQREGKTVKGSVEILDSRRLAGLASEGLLALSLE